MTDSDRDSSNINKAGAVSQGDGSQKPSKTNIGKIFLIYLRLGLTSFGGSFAHIGYFRAEFVKKRQWLSERNFADLVALCQFLPGPTSSQISMTIGLMRGGFWGAFAAWAGFSLPSFLMMASLAISFTRFSHIIPHSALHGLKLVVVAVVAQAVWGMGRSLLREKRQYLLVALASLAILWVPLPMSQIIVMLISAMLGLLIFQPHPVLTHDVMHIAVSRRLGLTLLAVFFAILLGLPALLWIWPNHLLEFMAAFYRAGTLVFGGGYLLLPFLQAEVVPNNWVSHDVFMAGYGATLALPGPVFSFAAFLGGAMTEPPNGWLGAILAYIAIFGPSFLLVGGIMPFWRALLINPRAQAALMGVNAAVVAVLLAALYDPIWRHSVYNFQDVLVVIAVLLIVIWDKIPSWLLVVLVGGVNWALGIGD
ncbi:MAG: chromate efflux transporter [Alphaproteobacteria bacterium]|nr:chromate efflux transporter [Alphaproteobacteria bacterium]